MTNIPLLAVGIFVIYIAAVDDGLFNIVLDSTGTDRVGVTIATTVAAAVPMFFAVGMIREGIFERKWFTIHQYERMLEGKGFWIIAILLLIAVAALNIFDMVILGGCIISIIILAIYIKKNKS